MLKKVIFFLLITICFKLVAQQDTSLIYYNYGVKAFKNKAYLLADSMFSLSIKLKPHPDTYFSRAAVRNKLNNKTGYCEDLCYAAVLGDKECDSLFCVECGLKDTAFTSSKDITSCRKDHFYYTVVYQSEYKNANIAVKYARTHQFISSTRFEPEPILLNDTLSVKQPEFPGGMPTLMLFIQNEVKKIDVSKKKSGR